MNRRTLLRWGVAAGGVGIVGVGWPLGQTMLGPADPGRLLRSQAALPPPYRSMLPIPTRLNPVATDDTTDFYAITQRIADLAILPGLSTRAWTYDGTFPGPTIVSKSGRRAVGFHASGAHQALKLAGDVRAELGQQKWDALIECGDASWPIRHVGHTSTTCDNHL